MSLVDYQSSSEDEEPTVKEPVKKREPVKISIPTFADDEDEDKSSEKKCKFGSSLGLLGMLPPPKFSALRGKGNSLTPYVLTKKKEPSSNKNIPKKLPTTASHSHEKTSEKLNTIPTSKEDTEPQVKCDFFSLQSSDKIEEYIPLPPEKPIMFKGLPTPISTMYSAVSATVSASSSTEPQPSNYFKAEAHPQAVDVDQNGIHVHTDLTAENEVTFTSIPEDMMKDARFQRLQGKHGKEELNIIDVNLDLQLPSKTEWHTKSITEEKVSHSRKRHHMPTQQQKRKHQITYLAFQAKEREIDLKNQWAHNRLTKKETQAKYGF